jgi:peptide/nickel transport system substrate-binding protein
MRAGLLAAAAALAVAIGAGHPASADASELVIARAVSVNAMDPGFLRESAVVVDNIFDTLVLRDAEMKLAPGLAESWTAVDDTTWEFKLRHGVSFHNGEPFNAAAVKFTIDRVLDPEAKSPTISYIRTVAGVDVVDDYTVRIRTTAPDPLLPTRFSRYPTYIVPPGYVGEVGPEEFARHPVGTGPYKFVEFVPDDHVTLEANPDYWRGKPSIDTVVWRPIPEGTARVTALLTGEVQLVEGVPAELADLVRQSGEADLVQVKNGGLTIYYGLKSAEPPLDNAKVREALSVAIDRQTIVDSLLHGLATPSGTMAGPYDFGYLAVPAPAYDPEKAKALLAEAGYPDGFEIKVQAPSRYISSDQVAQAIAQQWGEIGVKADLEIPEWSVYTQQVPAGEQAPVYMLAWGSTQTLDADAALYAILKTGEPYSTFSSPELDALLDQSRSTIDPAAREDILHKIQEYAAANTPLIPLYQEDSIYAKAKGVDFDGRPDARIPVFDITMQ